MQGQSCPVCGTTLQESGRNSDYGERHQYHCPRCGPFEITRTAIAMLKGRLAADPLARARLSHAIRQRTNEEKWLSVDSYSLDDLTATPLPDARRQSEYLLAWLRTVVQDDAFGVAELPPMDVLAGIVGAAGAEQAARLLTWIEGEGLLTLDREGDGTVVRALLTPVAWARVSPESATPSANSQSPAHANASAESTAEACVVRACCPSCGRGEKRNAFLRASFCQPGSDGNTSWSHTYSVLECCGCQALFVRHEHWFSEWDDWERDARTGQPQPVPGVKTEYWPAAPKRPKPPRSDLLRDIDLRETMTEVYSALNNNLLRLSAGGTRTLIDVAIRLTVGDKSNFPRGLEAMVAEGILHAPEKDVLLIMADVGNAALHRAHSPSPETLVE